MTDVSNNVEIDVSNVVVEENETYSLKSVLQKYINKSDGKLPLTMSLKRMIICITNVSSDSLAKIETLLEKIGKIHAIMDNMTRSDNMGLGENRSLQI